MARVLAEQMRIDEEQGGETGCPRLVRTLNRVVNERYIARTSSAMFRVSRHDAFFFILLNTPFSLQGSWWTIWYRY